MGEIEIGEQIWTTANLDVANYRNGDLIPEIKDPDEWKNLKTGAFCYFENNVNKNKGFKAAIGLRIGTLLQAHTKGIYSSSGTKTADKVVSKRFLDTWRFAATARLGYGNFSVFMAYNLNTLFKAGYGPDITPYSVGLCLSGL